MNWLIDIFSAEKQDTVAHIMLLYSIVIAWVSTLAKLRLEVSRLALPLCCLWASLLVTLSLQDLFLYWASYKTLG